jgi:hypothetical protein
MGGTLKGKVIDIKEWKNRKTYYPSEEPPEWLTLDDIERLSKEGKWSGTYSPLPPYGPEPRDAEDG